MTRSQDFYLHDRLQTVDIKALEHKRDVKKKTRSGDKRMRKMLKTASKVQ